MCIVKDIFETYVEKSNRRCYHGLFICPADIIYRMSVILHRPSK